MKWNDDERQRKGKMVKSRMRKTRRVNEKFETRLKDESGWKGWEGGVVTRSTFSQRRRVFQNSANNINERF